MKLDRWQTDLFDDSFQPPLRAHQCDGSDDFSMKHAKRPVLPHKGQPINNHNTMSFVSTFLHLFCSSIMIKPVCVTLRMRLNVDWIYEMSNKCAKKTFNKLILLQYICNFERQTYMCKMSNQNQHQQEK